MRLKVQSLQTIVGSAWLFKFGLSFISGSLIGSSAMAKMSCEQALAGFRQWQVDLIDVAQENGQLIVFKQQGQSTYYTLREFKSFALELNASNEMNYQKNPSFWRTADLAARQEELRNLIDQNRQASARNVRELQQKSNDQAQWEVSDSEWVNIPRSSKTVAEAFIRYREAIYRGLKSRQMIRLPLQGRIVFPRDIIASLEGGFIDLGEPERFVYIDIQQLINSEQERVNVMTAALERELESISEVETENSIGVSQNSEKKTVVSSPELDLSDSSHWEPLSDREWLSYPRLNGDVVQAFNRYRSIVDKALKQKQLIATKRHSPMLPRQFLREISDGFVEYGPPELLQLIDYREVK